VKPLQSIFMGKLDHYTPKLLALYRKKGGAVGKKINETLEVLNEVLTVASESVQTPSLFPHFVVL